MREILFRGRRVDNGEWVYGHCFKGGLTADHVEGSKPEDGWYFLTGCQDRHFISQNGVVFEVAPETVGQYTGLKDKNGVKIFEGDVVYGKNIDDNILWVWYGVVKFNNYRLMFQEPKTEKWYEIDDFQFDEIIGNIHDNPELLEVKE